MTSQTDTLLDLLIKPLRYSTMDNFAHLKSLKGFDKLVEGLCSRAKDEDDESKDLLWKVRALTIGFDLKNFDEKKKTLEDILQIIKPSVEVATSAQLHSKPLSIAAAKKNIEMLSKPVQFVKGVGPKVAEMFKKKGILTVEDLLYYMPFRYEDRSKVKEISDLEIGESQSFNGEVLAFGEARYGRRRVFEVALGDGDTIIMLKWFHYRVAYMEKKFHVGDKVKVYGTVKKFGSKYEVVHPDVEMEGRKGKTSKTSGDGDEKKLYPMGLVPVYSQVENLHQNTIRKILSHAVLEYSKYAVSSVPLGVLESQKLLNIGDAFMETHLPGYLFKSKDMRESARRTLVFDELFTLEASQYFKKHKAKKSIAVKLVSKEGGLRDILYKSLPFKLTNAQVRVLKEIYGDLSSVNDADESFAEPMNRLIQGDVGCGKTIVSLLAMIAAVEGGCQAAIMAPTEILAEQHYLNIKNFCDNLGVTTVMLKSALKSKDKKDALALIRSGEAQIVVGTHSLIQDAVEFKKLVFTVIDEQHRFGVEQRKALMDKAYVDSDGVKFAPHNLVMTATPIPRTLSMTVFSDLDLSIIDELPPGRTPVVTKLLREGDRDKAYKIISDEVKNGAQAYIVYPLVEESEELTLKDAVSMKEKLDKEIFPDFNVTLVHGRMDSLEKQKVMDDFKNGKSDILVSTSVIEVGVDVPNATVMAIEHSERFGLSQLHQLRGRVGRGTKKSYCLLLTDGYLQEDTFNRLKVIESTEDGFKIAEEDLKFRGPGSFFGTKQSGLPDFRTTDILSDFDILRLAKKEAEAFLEDDKDLQTPEGLILKELLKTRWKGRLEYASIG